MTMSFARTARVVLTPAGRRDLQARIRRIRAASAADLDRRREALLLRHPRITRRWLTEHLPARSGQPAPDASATPLAPALVLRLRTMRRQERRFYRRRAMTVVLVERTLQTAATCLFAAHPDLQVICFSERNTEYNDESFEPGFDVLAAVVDGTVVEAHPALEVFTHVLSVVDVLFDCSAGLENLMLVRRDATGAVVVEDAGFQEDAEGILEDLAKDPACRI